MNINNKPYLYLSDSAVDNYEDCEYFKDYKSLYEKNLGFAYPIIDEWLLESKTESNSTEVKSSRRSKKTDYHNFEETFTKYSEDELGEIIIKNQK